jgi:hypothetical protein
MPTKKVTFIDPSKIKGDTGQIVKTILKLKPTDFPDSEQVLDVIRGLKTDADQGEMRLVAYLRAYEKSNLWKKSAVPSATFDAWLSYYQTSLPDVKRYRYGVTALTEFGPELCETHGFKVLSKVAGLPEGHRSRFIKEELEPGMETRRFPMSEVTASGRIHTYRKKYGLISKVPRIPKSNLATQLDEAEERVRELEDEVKALKKERNDLLKRLAKYEKKAA